MENLKAVRVIDDLEVIKQNILTDINKGEGTAAYLKHLEDRYLLAKEERSRMQELEKKAKQELDNFKEAVLNCLEETGTKFIETSIGKLSYTTTKRVKVIDEAKIPDKFKKQELTFKVSKNLIKEAIGNGEEVEGATVEINKTLKLK